MNFLKLVDGNKTYIMAILAGGFALIHFLSVGNYSLAALLQISQSEAIVGMVAALRHGVQKTQDAVGNQGNLISGLQKGV